MTFKYIQEPQPTIIELLDKPRRSFLHTITGSIKWTDPQAVEVNVKSNKAEVQQKKVREAIIAESTHYMPISIWEKTIDQITEEFP